MKTGETKDLNLKFPDSYQSTDLAGKDVVFTVTVNAFTRPAENIDGWELDDAWVAENTDYSTVEEYRAGKRAELEAANETTAENNLQNDAMQQVADGCTFHKIPKSYITLGEEDYDKRYTAYPPAKLIHSSLIGFPAQIVSCSRAETFVSRRPTFQMVPDLASTGSRSNLRASLVEEERLPRPRLPASTPSFIPWRTPSNCSCFA